MDGGTGGPDIFLVVARAENGVIGKDGWMPWRLPEDLKRFKRLTVGKPVIMGRKTFETLGRPLPQRPNIVLTRQPDWRADGVVTAGNLERALAAAGDAPEIAVIGGAEIYALALPSATRIELTEVHAAPGGDTAMPAFDSRDWRETARERRDGPEGEPDYSWVTLERR